MMAVNLAVNDHCSWLSMIILMLSALVIKTWLPRLGILDYREAQSARILLQNGGCRCNNQARRMIHLDLLVSKSCIISCASKIFKHFYVALAKSSYVP